MPACRASWTAEQDAHHIRQQKTTRFTGDLAEHLPTRAPSRPRDDIHVAFATTSTCLSVPICTSGQRMTGTPGPATRALVPSADVSRRQQTFLSAHHLSRHILVASDHVRR